MTARAKADVGLAARLRRVSLREGFYAALIAGFALFPLVAGPSGHANLISYVSLIMSFSIAAVSLNFILGYGGLISFGHAAFIAIGGYSVGIAVTHGVTNGLAHLAMVVVFSALFALITGAICIRTKGVYFIMITLAFAQMVYFAFVSIEKYGGDDGLTINQRSNFSPVLNLKNDLALYYTILVVLLVFVYLVHRLVHSRFGWVLRGIKSNEARMQTIGYPTFRYKLTAYVISGVMCGIAGMLFANYANFVNPEDAAWTTSGELIFMVVLGGMGSVFGPVLGAVVFFVMEEIVGSLPVVGIYWKIYFGPFLILVVLFAKGGIDSWLSRHPAGLSTPAPSAVRAPRGRRLLAAAIDVVLLVLATYLLVGLAGPALMKLPSAEHHQHFLFVLCTYALLALIFINHFALPASRRRGSIGKILTGLEIVSADGRTVSPSQATQRVFGQLLSVATGLIGYLRLLWRRDRQALHDTLSGTIVVVKGAEADG